MAVISEAIIGFTLWLTVRAPFCFPRVKNNTSSVQGIAARHNPYYSAYWFQIVSWKCLSRVSIWEKFVLQCDLCVCLCVFEPCLSSQFHEQTVISKSVLGDQTACSNHSSNTKRVSEIGMVNKWDRKRERENEKESLMDQVSSVQM